MLVIFLRVPFFWPCDSPFVRSRVHNRKREESIALAYHPCAKFSGGQVGANMSESACG